jgi:predicted SAM-dependent methyltransferase
MQDILKLDLGCGKNKVAGYTGIDINPNSNADIVASVLELPFDDNSVDEIYSSHLVEHFDPREAQIFFDEIYRVLKLGSKAYLKIDRDWTKRKLFKKDPTHKHRYTEDEIKKIVKKFSKIEVKDKIYFLNFYTLRRKIFVYLIK